MWGAPSCRKMWMRAAATCSAVGIGEVRNSPKSFASFRQNSSRSASNPRATTAECRRFGRLMSNKRSAGLRRTSSLQKLGSLKGAGTIDIDIGRTVTDTTAAEPNKFYRLAIVKPWQLRSTEAFQASFLAVFGSLGAKAGSKFPRIGLRLRYASGFRNHAGRSGVPVIVVVVRDGPSARKPDRKSCPALSEISGAATWGRRHGVHSLMSIAAYSPSLRR